MGGYGSGRWNWYTKRVTVEECLVLSADVLTRHRLLGPDRHESGTVIWTNTATGEKVSSIGYELNTLDMTSPWLRLEYSLDKIKKHVDYRIHLTTTALPWGGIRWWFLCPLAPAGWSCSRRVGKLYLPPRGRYYGCRHCYKLTYTSCQESRRLDGLYRLLAATAGTDLGTIKRVMADDLKRRTRDRKRKRTP